MILGDFPGQSELDLDGSPVDVHCLQERDL